MSKFSSSKPVQEKGSSANSPIPNAKKQEEKKPSEPTGGTPSTITEGLTISAQPEINKSVYSAGQIVSEKLRQLINEHSESESK